MDFYQMAIRESKGSTELYPDFIVGRSKDLMVRGRSFYAIWDDASGLWSTDEYDVQRLVDEELRTRAEADLKTTGQMHTVKYLRSFGGQGWVQFRKYLQNISDNSHPLDETLTFANSEVKKSDYISKRLPYPLTPGECPAWNELVGTLYSVDERAKIEWAIGSIVAGDSKKIQKFIVLYGLAGTGKSTILNIIQKLFEGYTTTFEAKALGSTSGSFATEAFRDNPLVAIQHDGDLSKIEDNTRLNSIIAHEPMTMNEKYKPSYTSRVNAFLFMGTNNPVRISDAKSGIIRRLIDVHPTGNRIQPNRYTTLLGQIDFELGAIASHCLDVYRRMGKNYYNTYRPVEMMLQTDVFFNFIESSFGIFKSQDGTTLKQAYSLYKEFCEETGIERVLPQYKFREELRNYFDEFKDRGDLNGTAARSVYVGFNADRFKQPTKDPNAYSLVLEESISLFDSEFAEAPAQLAKEDGTPKNFWANVKTMLQDINTRETHYVRVSDNHIVIDFDLKDDNGEKSLERNVAAASAWPATYGELSNSGRGVHLHYTYDGDASQLESIYSEGIEIKHYVGRGALRRRLTKCNNVPIAVLNSGLPIKEKKPVLSENTIKSERGLRDLIRRNLLKEIHPGTKPSIDFIAKILEEAYESGMSYDVRDLRPKILAFANNSTNQPLLSLKIVQRMRFQSDEAVVESAVIEPESDSPIVLFDVEVYPNLFIVCWKYKDVDNVVRMRNPTPQAVEELFKMKLVGFNNRRYDNHILYARHMGYDNERLYKLSQQIISGNSSALFGEAYNLSYADIYDFASKKQTLKRWEIELGVHHLELDIPWDEPVADVDIPRVEAYCENDVRATEVVFDDRKQDFVARQILADLSGLSVNDTTPKHTARILFGTDRTPQKKFVYTDLSKEFPGYKFELGKSSYRGEDPSEGGYVYAEPGIYEDVAVLDIASMHPTSIEQLNLFGPFTPRFAALKDARLAIKHRDYTTARTMLNGALAPHLEDEAGASALSYALKIVINTVYGLTSAKFDNPFRDIRNIDNIVAKRGALFMIDLKHAVQEKGFTVAHIKTDSIKIPNATPEIIDFVSRFGEKYGYTFEHETTYKKFCLVNDAVYVARDLGCDNQWVAVGAQFQHPYVYKRLFTGEDIQFDDLCETRQVQKGVIYIDYDAVQKPMFMDKGRQFVGRTGRFVPVTEESGGGLLLRVYDDKEFAITGTKGYLWMEAEQAQHSMTEPKIEIDMGYFESLADDAIKTINKFGAFSDFVKE